MNLSHRHPGPELMDAEDAPPEELHLVLRELEVIGRRLGGHQVTTNALEALLRQGYSIRSILDIGSGGGDAARAMAIWAKSKKLGLHITGADLNPVMTRYATEHSQAYPNLSFITADALDASLQGQQSDVVTASLFCHHFTDSALVDLLCRMQAIAGIAVVINDLHRHPLAYHGIRLLTRLFSKSYMVRYDAPMSVARSFRRKDWEALLERAGIRRYRLRWRWAWRWQLIIYS